MACRKFMDAHGLKIQGRGYLMFFAKIPRGGGSRLPGNIDWEGPLILGFIAFLLTSVLKFARGGYYIYPPPSSHLTPFPLCASMVEMFSDCSGVARI
jgi:hypothetical protein